jgi:hypothetical protein
MCQPEDYRQEINQPEANPQSWLIAFLTAGYGGPQHQSANAALAEPRTVLLIDSFDVLQKPIVQLAQQRTQMNRLAVLQPVRRLQDLSQHSVVLRAMLIQASKTGLRHQLFLAPEVHAREFDELVEQFADPFVAGAAHQRETELVNGVHEDAVLIVHGANADRAGVVPGEKSQMSLHE